MLYDDDKKKKKDKEGEKVTKNEADSKGIVVGGTRKRKTIVAALGNTDAFQNHLDRKGERIWERKYKDERDYQGFNKDMANRNNKLAEKGISKRFGYRF